MPLHQLVGTCVRPAGNDPVHLSSRDARQSAKLLRGSLVEVHRALGLEGVLDAFYDCFRILAGFSGGLGGVLPDRLRIALGGSAADGCEQDESDGAKQCALHDYFDAELQTGGRL